jgi:glycosyltransferase involved in cell wall biosynthesis
MFVNPAARRVLFIAYYFPPLGMGGTQRLAKWCKYFRRDGWTPTVITVKPIAYYAYDESLLDDVSGVEVIRTESLDPARLLFRWRGAPAPPRLGNEPRMRSGAGTTHAGKRRWISWFFVPDSRVLWLPFAIWQALRLARSEKYLAIVTSGPPHSSHFVGWLVKKIFAITWLADFRDSWSGGDVQPEPTPLHRWLNHVMQMFILRHADVATTISPQLVDELKGHADSASVAPHLVPNGYDPEDFAATPPVEKIFTVALCGSATRIANPQTLIEGFRLFTELGQLAPAEARLRFVGADLLDKVSTWVAENHLQPFVETAGYVPHAQAVAAMQQAAVLVYVAAPGTSVVTVGGKTYEYLAARRPVLCIGERVEGMQLLQRYARTRRCDFHAIDEIARALLAFYREFVSGALPPGPAAPEEFSRRFQARQVQALLNSRIK